MSVSASGWQVWRQDDNGNRFLVGAYPDRVEALTRVLIFEAGYQHKQLYEVVGPPGPVVRANRDLYVRVVVLGDQIAAGGRALLDYLCALWAVTRPLGLYERFDGDVVAAILAAAATAPPVRPDPAWRVADLTTSSQFWGFTDFTKVLCTQIADLLAFEEYPPGPYAALGVNAPARIDGGRATIERWCNFDPPTFLECAAAGAFGGWDPADGRRVRTADGEGEGEALSALEPITWGDFAAFLEYGQSYE